MIFHLLLEGHLEEPVARKLLQHCGHEAGTVYGKQGFGYIRTKAKGFVHLVKPGVGVLALTDFMDSGCLCVPQACRLYLWRHVSSVPEAFLCRFAVNELESWLMADRSGLSKFLRIPIAIIPEEPEKEADPKKTMVWLARQSRTRWVREALAPAHRHGGAVGPEYTPKMSDFARLHWSPERAAKYSPSLARCVERLRELPGHSGRQSASQKE